MLSPAQATLRARIGAHALHATHDPEATTAAGRAAFLRGFEKQVDPDGTLPVAERLRRADHAKRAHFTKLALASSLARSRARSKKSRGNAIAEAGTSATAGTEAGHDQDAASPA